MALSLLTAETARCGVRAGRDLAEGELCWSGRHGRWVRLLRWVGGQAVVEDEATGAELPVPVRPGELLPV